MIKINLLTLFPNFFSSSLNVSILKKAQEFKKVEFNVVNIRDYALDKHQVTDEPPYGGGAGMVMKIEPIDRALEALNLHKGDSKKKIVLTSAKGMLFNQQVASEYSHLDELTIICGHYEGVDERVANHLIDEEVRIGDYVITGGEPAALVISDAVSRLIPGVLGNEQSLIRESHTQPGYLTYPQYTRPEVYKGWSVPEILLSGNHELVDSWRQSKTKKIKQ